MRRILGVSILAFLTGCAGGSGGQTVITAKQAGPINVGMSAEEVRTVLGSPASVSGATTSIEPAVGAATVARSESWTYDSPRIVVVIVNGRVAATSRY